MTVTQLFGTDESIISETNFEAAFGGLLEGVLLGYSYECRVHAPFPIMQVRILAGILAVGGVFIDVEATGLLLDAADLALPRYDRVVARRDNNTNAVWIGVKTGTPAANPVPPTLTRAGGIYEISLAQIYVKAGDAGITDNEIIDERGDPAVCGYMSFKASEHIDRGFVAGNRQRGEWSAYCHATALDGSLLYRDVISEDNASAIIQDADGVALQQDTLIAAESAARSRSNNVCHRREYHSVIEIKFKLSSITAIRAFLGFTESPLVLTADAPAFAYAGLQFSTSRGDTTWQFALRDGATQQLVDSGLTPDTNAHFLRVTFDEAESKILVELFDANHEIEISYAFTAGLPALTKEFENFSGILGRSAGVKSIYQYHAHGTNRSI